MVPVTVMQNSPRQAPTDVPYHPTYSGSVFFRNTFDGKLSAADYPKVNVRLMGIVNEAEKVIDVRTQFYFAMFIVYTVLACGWAWLCYTNLQDLLPVQVILRMYSGSNVCSLLPFASSTTRPACWVS